MFKDYIGDGVYIETTTPQDFVLTSENGIEVLDTIYLDRRMISAIVRYADEYVPAKIKEGASFRAQVSMLMEEPDDG